MFYRIVLSNDNNKKVGKDRDDIDNNTALVKRNED